MKETYISPEIKLVGFVPKEQLANIDLDFSNFPGISLSPGNAAISDTDIKIPIK